MTTIEPSKIQTVNKRSISNPRGGFGISQCISKSSSNNNKVKKATTVSSITFGSRKNSGKNLNEDCAPPHQSQSSNNMNVISTPRQCSQLLPASAIITSNCHNSFTNNHQQKALNIINSQILNSSSSNTCNKSSGGMKCMTPVLLNRQKQQSSCHSVKNSIGSMPGSASNKKSVNTPTSVGKRNSNQTITILNNNMQSQPSYQQGISASNQYIHHNVGSGTPSTPLKNNIISQRPSSAARSHSSLINSIANTPGKGGASNNSINATSKISTSMIQTDSEQLNKQQEDVENNIFMKRVFVNTQQTSDAIHLSWLHPRNFSKKQKQYMKMKEEKKQECKGGESISEYLTTSTNNNSNNNNNSNILNTLEQIGDDAYLYRNSLNYILEYGVGVKVNNKEQFRQIYKGPQHKCIITDLNPKTVYRFRVTPYMVNESNTDKQIKGQWSDTIEVMTRDNIAVETRSMAKHARLINSGKTILFQKQRFFSFLIQYNRPGLVHATYGYFFGKYCWSITIQLTSNGLLNHQDCTGLMKVGVAVRQGRAYKLVGVNVNYSLEKSQFLVKLILDCDARNLKIQTASEGWEVLPLSKHFPYIPAIQNKTPLRGPNYQLKSRILFDQKFQQ